MSDITLGRATAEARRAPPIATTGPWAWARENLFANWWSTAVTLVLAYLIIRWTIAARCRSRG